MSLRGMCWGLLSLVGLWMGSAVWAGSSNSLLDLSADGKLLLAANPDNDSVTVVDVVHDNPLREIPVGRQPEGVTFLGNGPLAAVTSYQENAVIFFNAENGAILKKLPVRPEPYGLVSDRAGKRAWVSHDHPGSVSEIDLTKKTVVREFKVGAFTRGLALSSDEQRLYVTEFYTGILKAVDLKTGIVVDAWKGHATDNLCRNVVVHPKRPKAYLPHIRSMVEVNSGAGSIFPQLSICALVPPDGTRRRTSFAMDTFNGVYVTTNAWEVALSPDGQRLYTIYAGTNDMNISKVIDDDYQEMARIGGPVQVGQNPRAVRVTPDNQKVYIYNTLDFALGVYKADTMKPLTSIKVCELPKTKTPEWLRGKILFNTAKYPMSQRRWIACASCHPDGQHDARVWQNPEGLRKTTALFGMAHTHPIHWSADRDEVQDFEYTIRSRLMAGAGLLQGPLLSKNNYKKVELEDKTAGRSKDLDALAIYCNSFEFTTLSPYNQAPGKLTPAAERGKTLFFSKEVGCATCHSGPYYTDSSLHKPFKLHDVGIGNDDRTEKMGPAYDTPTLLGVYRTAPYLHHGKAKTLREVLTTYNKQDKHGRTSQLQGGQLDDLVAFVQALPYELPPYETPNTVKYRVPVKLEGTKR